MGDSSTFEYRLPSLGADMDEGRVIEWRVAVGDAVHRGDLIAVIETEKSDIDIEIWHDGVIEELLVGVGELIDVGTPIVRLRDPAAPPTTTPAAQPTTTPATAPERPAPAARLSSPERVLASPLARRTAAERGLDLASIHGSGPHGAVVAVDLDGAMPGPPAPLQRHQPPSTTPVTDRQRSRDSMRSAIAERMSRANRDIPHYHLARDIEVGALGTWLDRRNATKPITERLLIAACYVRAVALAASRHRELNGFWIDDRFEPATDVNVAMIISLRGGGLVAPHVERADQRSVDEIMVALNELVREARTGTLRGSWLTGSTITVTNLGDTGADLVHGVISPPQVALVGFGRTRARPWVIDDLVTVRPVVTATLAADHRATDGAVGSRFLSTVADELEHLTDLEDRATS